MIDEHGCHLPFNTHTSNALDEPLIAAWLQSGGSYQVSVITKVPGKPCVMY